MLITLTFQAHSKLKFGKSSLQKINKRKCNKKNAYDNLIDSFQTSKALNFSLFVSLSFFLSFKHTRIVV